ncbi:hypothetical protein BS78_05G242100 [Paspalum vaginatum]|nr:hypothetical protein BS78_05G242100 [Paspalum vaginatum]
MVLGLYFPSTNYGPFKPLAHEKRSRCLQATEFSHVGPESTNGGVDIDGHHSSKDQHSLNRAAVDNQYSPNHAST